MSVLSIEEQASQTYHDNIAYLQEHQPRLLQKIADFESALDGGHYQARYELEYKEEGYFDVKEISTGNYFYGVSSQKYAAKASKIVNFKKEESTFKTFFDYSFSQEELENIKKEDIASSSLYGYGEIMAYTNRVVPKDAQMMDIKKFIFFGVGLGRHIEEIDKKIKAENYLLIEDDLELFRLSMFVTNYQKLSQKARLFFVIFENQESAKGIFSEFLQKSFYFNHYIKYFQMQHNSDEMMKLMQTTIVSQPHLTYLYNAFFLLHLRALEYIKEGYHFLDVRGVDFSDSFLEKPILLLAAGPSLEKNIDFLEKNSDKFIIVALSATLKILEERGVKPDVVVHLDPFEKTCMIHLDALKSKAFYSDCILFCGTQTPKVLVERFDKEKVFIAQVSTYYKDSGSLDPLCVGSFAYMLLTTLGARELYALGLDLSLDSETGVSHSKGHSYAKEYDSSMVDKVEEQIAYLDAVVKNRGNFREEVLSTLTFDKSIATINAFSKLYKRDFQCFYNLSDGAYLNGLEPLKIEKLDMKKFKPISKLALQKALLKSLKKKSTSFLNEDESDSMKKRLEYIGELKEKIKKSQYPNSFNARLYQSQLLGLTLDILDGYVVEAVDMHNVYMSYFHYILPYIFDMVNTKGLQNEKRHIKKVHAILIKRCLEIAEYYEKDIVKFFEEEGVH